MGKLWRVSLLTTLLFVVASHHTLSQSDEDLNSALRLQMKGIAKRYADSVVLRWAPNNAAMWRIAKAQGFRIERAEIVNGTVGAFSAISADVVKPWSPQQWSTFLQAYAYADSTEEQLIAVASMLTEQDEAPANSTASDPGDLAALRGSRNKSEMAYSFALIVAERSRVAANGLGMRYVDKTAVLGTPYQYRISVAGSTAPYIVAPAQTNVAARPIDTKKNDAGLTALELDTRVVLTWDNTTGHSTFDVYRSTDGKNFAKRNVSPILTLRQGTIDSESNGWIDSNLVNYTTYHYRIMGNNSFAEVDEISMMKAMPRDLTPPPTPTGVRTEHVQEADVAITWDMPESLPRDLVGFYIQRSNSEEGTFQLLNTQPLAPQSRKYVDTSATLGDTLYYQVVAVDTAKNGSVSYSVYVAFADSIAPSAAVLVNGTMDSAGVVRVVIRHPYESDVMGYRLLIANDTTHEFSVKRELFNEDSALVRGDTIITDTVEIRTLTKYVYYRVVSLDYHFNESELSNIVAVPRPDIIAPVAPVITDYVVTDSSVVLQYNRSSSKDVRHHIIQRRAYINNDELSMPWDSLMRGGNLDSVVVDTSGALAATYQYTIVAVDSAGNHSPLSNIVTLIRYDNGKRPPVRGLRAEYDSVAKTVRLQWTYSDIGEPFSFMIYKNTANSPTSSIPNTLESFAIIKDQRQREFIDVKDAAQGIVYAIKVLCNQGAESKMSESVTAR